MGGEKLKKAQEPGVPLAEFGKKGALTAVKRYDGIWTHAHIRGGHEECQHGFIGGEEVDTARSSATLPPLDTARSSAILPPHRTQARGKFTRKHMLMVASKSS